MVSEDPLFNERIRVTIRTVYLGPDEEEVTCSLSRYFLVKTETGFLVEMIEYLESALPDDEVARIIH